MGFGFRKAGEVFGDAATGTAKKEGLRQGTRGVFGIDQNVVDTAVGVGREVISGIHPALGVIDDLFSVKQNAEKIDNAMSRDDVGSGAIGLVQSGASLAGAGAKAAGAAGTAGAIGAIAPLALPGVIKAPHVTRTMNDPQVRAEDTAAFKKAFYR